MLQGGKDRIRQFLSRVVRRELQNQSHSIDLARSRRLAAEAAEFVDERMGTVPGFGNRFALLAAALREVDPALGGLFCEFGVFEGLSLNFIAQKVPGEVHGFDSFEGLPEDWRPGVGRGRFHTGKLPATRKNVTIHPGWFRDSLPRFARDHNGPLAFAHIDCDLYSSTKTIFDVLGSRFVSGTVIQFDEYFNYPGWKQGEHRAFAEFCESRGVTVRYIGYTASNSPAQIALCVASVAS